MHVQRPPDIDVLFGRLDIDRLRLVLGARPQPDDDRYLHWDDLRHRRPPEPLTLEEEQAVDELHGYLRREVREVRDVERLVRGSDALDHRELALLGDAVRNPSSTCSHAVHARIHRVTHETARTDLLDLASLGLIEQQGRRRPHSYHPPEDLADRLKTLDHAA